MNLKSMAAAVEKLLGKADAEFKSELETLKATVSGTLTQLQADLATATASIASLGTAKAELETSVQELTGKLSSANKVETDAIATLRSHLATLPGQDKTRLETATLSELLTLQQNAVNAALAATGVKLESLPSGGTLPGKGQSKTMARADFEALDFKARNEFIGTGGKLKD
jgi:chromosome segregation ATPase